MPMAGTKCGLAQVHLHISTRKHWNAFVLHIFRKHIKMADNIEKYEVCDQIAQELSQTPFACSSLTRLSGGNANFVYRGTPASSPDSIIIKHTKGYASSNLDFNLDPKRCVRFFFPLLERQIPY